MISHQIYCLMIDFNDWRLNPMKKPLVDYDEWLVGSVGIAPTTLALSYHFGFHRLLQVRGLDYVFTISLRT
jgi:hypothetical protein